MPTLAKCGCGRGLPAKRFLRTKEGEVLVCVACHAQGLAQHGRQPHTQRHPWTEADTFALLRWYDAGYSLGAIGRKLGHTRHYISMKLAERGLRGRRQALYTANEVATCVFQEWDGACSTVLRWVREGVLRATRLRGELRQGRYWICHDDFLAFLEREEKWMAWHPNNLSDPAVRAWASTMRAAVPWRWLTLEEAAECLNCCSRSVQHYIEKGVLPGEKEDRWWVRSDHVDYLAHNLHLLPGAGERHGPRREQLLADVRAALAGLGGRS